jgi:predicted nucleic acid-binding Zn ribbon protein
LYDDPQARAADNATDFAARRQREERRTYARRPKKIADVIAQLITQRGYGRIQANEELADVWAAAAGEPLATYSRPGKIRRGTLEITVTNSTIMQEFTFQKERILANLGRKLPDAKIRDLRFRVGTIQ